MPFLNYLLGNFYINLHKNDIMEITDKDKKIVELATEIHDLADKLYDLFEDWKQLTGYEGWIRNENYKEAANEVMYDMHEKIVNITKECGDGSFPEYDEPVNMLQIGQSYWSWISHYEGAGSEEVTVVGRKGKKVYVKLWGIIAFGWAYTNTRKVDGVEETYEKVELCWNKDGYYYHGDIAAWDKVE